MEIKYSQWHINTANPPTDPQDKNYNDYWDFHEELCRDGFTIDGVFFPGTLYWHLNFWMTDVDHPNPNGGKPIQRYEHPLFRDNEWIIFNAINRAENEGKGLAIAGARRAGKSVFEASYISHGAVFDKDSQNVIAGLNSADIKLITDKIAKGLLHVPSAWKWSLVEKSWTKQVTLGITETDNTVIPFSQILIRNLDNGANEEAIAGTKPRKLIIDEALHKDSLVYKSTNTCRIEDINVGDKIYGDDGNLTKILDKVDVGAVDLYELTFKDGRKIKASGNHTWVLYNQYLKKEVEITTSQLIAKGIFFEKYDKRYDKTIKSFIYSVKNSRAVDYQPKDLEIDPYYLGLWLGDGTTSNAINICTIDQQIKDYCKTIAERYNLVYKEDKDPCKHKDFVQISLHRKKGEMNGGKNILRELFREENLEGNKHIPKKYLYSSYNQRLELLKGLMDTDGSVYKRGTIAFSTSLPRLAEDFEFLVRSLGISINKTKKKTTYTYKGEKREGKPTFKFSISTGIKIFKLQRKIDNYKLSSGNTNSKKQMSYKKRCTLIDVKYIGKDNAYCLKVDNESHCFLTDGFTKTHNCGKGSFLNCLEASLPGMTTPYGYSCSAIITFTGGDSDNFKDAQTLFFSPEAYNFLAWDDEEVIGRKHGLFLGAKYRLEAKEPTTLDKYLGIESEELSKIPILVSNEEKAFQITDDILKKKLKTSSRKAYLKEKMYYPKKIDDVFLNEHTSIFNVELAKQQKERLLANDIRATYVELEETMDGIRHKLSKKLPIMTYPIKADEDTDAPIQVWEFPMANPPFGLYVCGQDTYRQTDASDSESLGTTYVFKRIFSATTNTFQDMIVASYAARPKDKDTWNNQSRLLIKWYNAISYVENDEPSFIDYMIMKGEGYYLADQPDWIKDIVPNTQVDRKKGVHRSGSPKMISFYHEKGAKYIDEVLDVERNDKGEVISTRYGVTRILDIALLDEIINWNPDANTDRIVAWELAVACAEKMGTAANMHVEDENPILKMLKKRQENGHKNKLFSGTTMFRGKQRRLF